MANSESIWPDLQKYKEALSWWVRRKIASFTLRHWKGILWTGQGLILLVLGALVYRFWSEGWNTIGFVLTVLFGLVSVISLVVSITVLHFVRDLIPDYSQAAMAFEKVIRGAKHTLYILTENPAFLQVLDHNGLKSYFAILSHCLTQGTLQRVVFAYINRQTLITEKIPKWAEVLKIDETKIIKELFNPYAFALAGNPNLENRVFFIPLKTSSLPFFIAVADDDQIAMFCRSKVDDADIRKSILRGFVTLDPYIVRALRSVFLKSMELDAVIYQYKCETCTDQQPLYMFDHQLIQEAMLNSNNAASIPCIKCNICRNDMSGEPAMLSEVDPQYFENVFGTKPED